MSRFDQLPNLKAEGPGAPPSEVYSTVARRLGEFASLALVWPLGQPRSV